jgi:hypothetical protein
MQIVQLEITEETETELHPTEDHQEIEEIHLMEILLTE